MSEPEAIDVEIRWPDVDAFGHVSHMALVAIAEHGRSRWFDRVLEFAPSPWPYVLARLEMDFRAPILFTDRFVRCRFEPVHVGSSSVQLQERFTAPDGRLVMDAQSVVVVWDQERSTKRALTKQESARLASVCGGGALHTS